jgi:hypothetical protein
MSNVSIMTGTGEGTLAKVSTTGSLQSEVVNTVDVDVGNTVTVQKEGFTVYRTHSSVGTTSATLVGARAGRQGLWIQNQGANPVYLRFENAAAANTDWLVPAGGEFRAEDFSYAGIVTAIAGGAASNVLALEVAP